MEATRLASGIFSAASSRGKRCSYYLVEFVFSPLIYPDARRVALSLQQLSGAAANLQTLLNRTL